MATLPNPAQSMESTPAPTVPVAAAIPPADLHRTLWQLVKQLELDDELPRRRELRDIVKRRLFFRGEQYWCWSENNGGIWLPPELMSAATHPDEDEYQLPAFQHVTNIFQAYGLSIMTIMSQNTVRSRMWPQSPSDPKDVSTSKQANKVIDFIHRNNDMQNKADEASYYAWTDGFMASYTRFVTDGDRFGFDQIPQMEQVDSPLSPAMSVCQECFYYREGDPILDEICPECGAPLQAVPAQTVPVPMQTGVKPIPRGQEVITIIPALHLKRPMWASEQHEFLYLTWIRDAHRAMVQHAYPHLSEQIGKANVGGDSGHEEVWERQARRLLYIGSGRHLGADLKDLGTLRTTWLRPHAFHLVHNREHREALLQQYPEGCRIVFFGDLVCEVQPERMDDHMETVHVLPGEGQVRETMGSPVIPAQEQLNDSVNLLFETAMYGVPEGFAAQDLIDFEARRKQSALPGQITPVSLDARTDISSKIKFNPAVEPSAALTNYLGQLFSTIPQFLCGAFPALFGGAETGTDTASGIAMQRNQAMGRVGRAWRRLQIFWANTDAKSVRVFARNRTEDVEIAVLGDGGDYQPEWIALEELQGNIVAYPEIDQQFPILQAEVRGLFLNLVNSGNEVFNAMLASDPANLDYFMRQIGAGDVSVPGADQRRKTYKDIERLIQEQPVLGPGEIMLPSLQPDPTIDILPVALQTARKWLLSDAGLSLRDTNPPAYENVKLYALACDMFLKMQQLQTAMTKATLGAQGQMGGENPNGSQPSEGVSPLEQSSAAEAGAEPPMSPDNPSPSGSLS